VNEIVLIGLAANRGKRRRSTTRALRHAKARALSRLLSVDPTFLVGDDEDVALPTYPRTRADSRFPVQSSEETDRGTIRETYELAASTLAPDQAVVLALMEEGVITAARA
jgi:hypothetical protein